MLVLKLTGLKYTRFSSNQFFHRSKFSNYGLHVRRIMSDSILVNRQRGLRIFAAVSLPLYSE